MEQILSSVEEETIDRCKNFTKIESLQSEFVSQNCNLKTPEFLVEEILDNSIDETLKQIVSSKTDIFSNNENSDTELFSKSVESNDGIINESESCIVNDSDLIPCHPQNEIADSSILVQNETDISENLDKPITQQELQPNKSVTDNCKDKKVESSEKANEVKKKNNRHLKKIKTLSLSCEIQSDNEISSSSGYSNNETKMHLSDDLTINLRKRKREQVNNHSDLHKNENKESISTSKRNKCTEMSFSNFDPTLSSKELNILKKVKPGRPRKSENKSIEGFSVISHKKRGRPPKVMKNIHIKKLSISKKNKESTDIERPKGKLKENEKEILDGSEQKEKRSRGRPKTGYLGILNENGHLKRKTGRPFKSLYNMEKALIKSGAKKLDNITIVTKGNGNLLKTVILTEKIYQKLETENKHLQKNESSKSKTVSDVIEVKSDSKNHNIIQISKLLNDEDIIEKCSHTAISETCNKTDKVLANDVQNFESNDEESKNESGKHFVADKVLTNTNNSINGSDELEISNLIKECKLTETAVDKTEKTIADDETRESILNIDGLSSNTDMQIPAANNLKNLSIENQCQETSFIQNGEKEFLYPDSSDISRFSTPIKSCLVKRNSHKKEKNKNQTPLFALNLTPINIKNPFPGYIQPNQNMVEKYNRQFFKSYVKIQKVKNIADIISIKDWEQHCNANDNKKIKKQNKSVSFFETVEVYGDDSDLDETDNDGNSVDEEVTGNNQMDLLPSTKNDNC